jgi:hypothetical protein
MMRRSAFLLLSAVVAGTVLLPSAAVAKGSKLHFGEDEYTPGDRAVAHAEAETWPGSGNDPKGGPYWVYLVPGTQPLWFGHLPRDAIRVGELHVGALLEGDSTSETYRVRVAFEVPRVEDGRYAVWVCRAECGADKGFGDLVYGHIVIARNGELASEVAPQEFAAPATSESQARRSGFPWPVLALAALAGAILAGAWQLRRSPHDRRQTSRP